MSINGTLSADKGLSVPGVLEALVSEVGVGMVRIEYDATIRGGLELGCDFAVLGNMLGMTVARIEGLQDALNALSTNISYRALKEHPQFVGHVGIGMIAGEVSTGVPASSSLLVAGDRNVHRVLGCHLGYASAGCYGMTFNVLDTTCNSSICFKYSKK